MKDWLGKVHHGDCLEVMRQIPDGSVDLCVTSPPYNLLNTTGGGIEWGQGLRRQPKSHPMVDAYDEHEDNMPHDEYVAWQRACLTEMMRLIPDTGAIFYNHKWRVQAGVLQDRADIMEGFPVRQIIIWDHGRGMNFNPGYFLPAYEVVYFIAKPKFRLATLANRHGNLWKFPREQGNPHPAPYPVKLAQRCISSTTAQVVLDPFLGSGTTAIAAIRAKRDWIGIEKSETYCRMAEKRVESEMRQPMLL